VSVPRSRLWAVLIALLVAGAALSLSCGPLGFPSDPLTLQLRYPRVLLALLAGSALAASGCILQSLLRNDLAEPYTLGISAGAGLVAGVLIIARPLVSPVLFVVAGCGGALAASAGVSALARAAGGDDSSRLILAGVTINIVGASLLLLVEYFSPASRLVEIVRWMMGDLSAVDPGIPLVLIPFAAAGLLAALPRTGTLNQLMLGEELAATRGVDVARERRILHLSAVLLAGGAVGAVGPVGFVGLIVPHIVRRIAGPDNRTLLPASAAGGAVVLLLADVVSRTVLPPAEIPIGVVMALLGGPFFLALLMGRGRL
jgi:iron complex transport system permease protein